MSSIYTRTGDNKTTAIFDPQLKNTNRVHKDSLIVEAIGAVDELSSFIGVSRSFCEDGEIGQFLEYIQEKLFEIGAIISGAEIKFDDQATTKVEGEIDAMDVALPPLKNFLLPKGNIAATHFMYVRALARRTERRVVALSKATTLPSELFPFLNRLSDYFFVLFRHLNKEVESAQTIWVGRK